MKEFFDKMFSRQGLGKGKGSEVEFRTDAPRYMYWKMDDTTHREQRMTVRQRIGNELEFICVKMGGSEEADPQTAEGMSVIIIAISEEAKRQLYEALKSAISEDYKDPGGAVKKGKKIDFIEFGQIKRRNVIIRGSKYAYSGHNKITGWYLEPHTRDLIKGFILSILAELET